MEAAKHADKNIGLNAKQFLKTILLSQGDFARFLKANKEGISFERVVVVVGLSKEGSDTTGIPRAYRRLSRRACGDLQNESK